MLIKINTIVPKYFTPNSSEVWGKDFELNTKSKYLLKAVSGSGKSSFFNFLYGLNNKYSGFGAAISLTLEEDYDFQEKFSFTPYYRQYFLNKKDYGARGLFVEGMLRLAGGVNEELTFDSNTGFSTSVEENWFDLGAGLAVGHTWVSENGFVFELSFGGGRYLLDSKADDFFLRGGVLIGYRFF